jgi:hypothetical protein
MLNNKFIP